MLKDLFNVQKIILSDQAKIIGLVLLSLILLILPWLFLGYLSLLVDLLLTIGLLIYISYSYDVTIPFVGRFLKRGYFKVKFKIGSIKDQAKMSGQLNSRLFKLKLSLYKLILTILHYSILLFKSSTDSFAVLKDELQKLHGRTIYIRHRAANQIKSEKLTIESLAEKISRGEAIDIKAIKKLDDLFYKLHNQKQQRVSVMSLAGLLVLIVGTIAAGLVTSLIFPHIFSSKAATFSWLQNDWSDNASTTATASHTTDQTGWTKYYSYTAGIATTSGQVKLQRP